MLYTTLRNENAALFSLPMENDGKNIGKNIRALRLAKGWTQQDLADKLGCTQKTITAYECGTRYPTGDKIPLIAKVLDVSVAELYGQSWAKQARKPRSPKLWRKFEQLEELSDSDRRTIFRMIEGLLAQRKREKGQR
jgi:transcriptional regulator with XRE-family HTH domain